jgi:hypothetical protein
LLEAGVHFALQALFHIDDQMLKAVQPCLGGYQRLSSRRR